MQIYNFYACSVRPYFNCSLHVKIAYSDSEVGVKVHRLIV